MTQQTLPPLWLEKRGQINENTFCEAYLASHDLRCIGGRFYTPQGILTDESRLYQDIYQQIRPHVCKCLAKKVDALVRALWLAAYSPALPLELDRIHFANGCYYLDGGFRQTLSYCRSRLSVDYNENAAVPFRWLLFLQSLLDPVDILTLQEYLGYCLLPTTKAQKMLMLIGKGGEGKSQIGLVMKSIFADAMNISSIQKVEHNRFSRADLENKLLMVDDDMDLSALSRTNYLKSIITSDEKMDLERKGQQSYQGQLYVRFLCFGNGALTALYDRSDGFYRRQILLKTLDKPADRMDDPYLKEKLLEEKEGIVLWMLEGLQRLLKNNYRFTISERAKQNMKEIRASGDNLPEFLRSQGYVRYYPEGSCTTRQLYDIYRCWCQDNAESPRSIKSFSDSLRQHSSDYGLIPSQNLRGPAGTQNRGYRGIAPENGQLWGIYTDSQ